MASLRFLGRNETLDFPYERTVTMGNPKKSHPGPGETEQSNGLPLAGVGRGAQGLTGFGSWGTGRQAKGSGTYGL
ncbi:hypothetical protein BACI349Y_900001 [Bacillus sp. 349Y]|nr:hypothetical protein BACI349Y_900001 [Bacillus sp. 349Y]